MKRAWYSIWLSNHILLFWLLWTWNSKFWSATSVRPVIEVRVLCLVVQSCPTLCDPMGGSLPGSSVHGDSPGKNSEVGCHALLQGIFSTQGLKPDLPPCRQMLYHLMHQGSPEVRLELSKWQLWLQLSSGKPWLSGEGQTSWNSALGWEHAQLPFSAPGKATSRPGCVPTV